MPESQTAGTAVSGSLQPPPLPEWFSYDILLHGRCGRKLSEHPAPHAPAIDCPFPALPPREFARVTSPQVAVDPAGSPHSSFPHRRVYVTPTAHQKLAGQHTTDEETDRG